MVSHHGDSHFTEEQDKDVHSRLHYLPSSSLDAAIRQSNNIKGIQSENSQHKISLYADDIFLFLQTKTNHCKKHLI